MTVLRALSFLQTQAKLIHLSQIDHIKQDSAPSWAPLFYMLWSPGSRNLKGLKLGLPSSFSTTKEQLAKLLAVQSVWSDRLKNKGWEKCRHKFVLGILIWKNIEHTWEWSTDIKIYF